MVKYFILWCRGKVGGIIINDATLGSITCDYSLLFCEIVTELIFAIHVRSVIPKSIYVNMYIEDTRQILMLARRQKSAEIMG